MTIKTAEVTSRATLLKFAGSWNFNYEAYLEFTIVGTLICKCTNIAAKISDFHNSIVFLSFPTANI